MPGRPEFLAIWVGITRVGGVVALVNTHLTGTALAYCINAVSPKHIIVAAELFGSLESARAAHHRRRADLAARQCRRQFRAHRPRDRRPFRRRPPGVRCSRPHHRGRRALHLHLGHDRPAESGQHEPLPRDAREQRLRRRHGYARQRPHVRLSAAVSHRRRRGRDRRASGPRRLGGDPGQVFRKRVLGRHRALGVHLLSIYRRALPLPHQLAAAARTSARTIFASPAATACGPTSGRNSSDVSAFRASSSSTPPPKATFRCSISTARKAR